MRFFCNIKNVLIWGQNALLIGFALGTTTLNGPVRWITNFTRSHDWAPGVEDWLVRGVMFLLLVVTLTLSIWFTRTMLASPHKHVKYGIPALCALFTIGALFLWFHPERFQKAEQSHRVTVGQFTFGPYPDLPTMLKLKKEGYRAIISLLHPAVVPFEPKLLQDEFENAGKAGIQLIHLPMLPWVSDNMHALDSIRTLATRAAGKYYVHCYLGKDRVSVVMNMLNKMGHSVAVQTVGNSSAARRLDEIPTFERGPIVTLEDSVYLTPYPTDEEFLAFFLTGALKQVVCLLDSNNSDDRYWIDKEARLLNQHQIPFVVYSIPIEPFEPGRVLEAVRKVRTLPRPLVVHGFLAKGPRWEGFIQAYRSNLLPLPPSNFPMPLQNGPVEIIAPNLALGPRPVGPEFGRELFLRGVRRFLYLGDPVSGDAREDSLICAAAGLNWSSFRGKTLDLLLMLQKGGPWYLYGPRAAPLREVLAYDLGPAIPERLRYSPEEIPRVASLGAPPAAEQAGFLPRMVGFIRRAVPSLYETILLSPVLLLYAVLSAALTGYLRSRKKIATPYTRKIFHLFIFTMASVLQFMLGLSAVVLFGVLVGLVVFYAIFRGDGYPFYEAMARPRDAPRRTLFIVIPYITTALGGVAANLFFAPFATIGYLVCGWGDAVGEPVGARWGRHPYRVPSLAGVPATRSLEGSLSVVLVGTLVAYLGLYFGGYATPLALGVALACGMVAALVEAISNHGLDNFTIQVAAAAVAFFLLG